jgi:hypothetical protein
VPSSIEGLRGRKKPLEFLGLFQCRNGACQWNTIPARRVRDLRPFVDFCNFWGFFQVSGDANEMQIVTSLQMYMFRARYLHKALNDAYRLLRYENCTRSHFILKVFTLTQFHILADLL